MDGCLSCKACATQCPIHVDIPTYKAKFLQLYYRQFRRPLRDYLIANIETILSIQSKLPRFWNSITQNPLSSFLFKHTLKLRDLPPLTQNPNHHLTFSHQHNHHSSPLNIPNVTLIQDAFTSFCDAPVLSDMVTFLNKMGLSVEVHPFFKNGKPLHITGFLDAFTKQVNQNSRLLKELTQSGQPLMGIEPSMTLVYRDEYCQCLKQKDPGFKVLLPQEFLSLHLDRLPKLTQPTHDFYLMSHCTEQTAEYNSQTQWKTIFEKMGLNLEIVPVGCCGMAGMYGHDTHHHTHSKHIYDLSWKNAIEKHSIQPHQLLVTGYSCRTQVKRISHFRPAHPIQALLNSIK
ncbi:MAG: (Fe-S)-binding protein [Candidatus Margulisbacteria bacterium]|nr:(Fe-S)-binding protein [Candidatus Margulisiibacteriota bacterium]